jgi:hypothetical protein
MSRSSDLARLLVLALLDTQAGNTLRQAREVAVERCYALIDQRAQVRRHVRLESVPCRDHPRHVLRNLDMAVAIGDDWGEPLDLIARLHDLAVRPRQIVEMADHLLDAPRPGTARACGCAQSP